MQWLLLQEEGLEPIELEAKEGLALINGTQAMTAQGVLFLYRSRSNCISSGINCFDDN